MLLLFFDIFVMESYVCITKYKKMELQSFEKYQKNKGIIMMNKEIVNIFIVLIP